jgi:hypothetical protein
VSGTRRWHGWARGAATPTPDAEVQQLLDDVHRLRLTLTADLSAAASAVEAEELQVARDIVNADSVEVRRLQRDARTRTSPVPAGRPVRPRRALLALPAIPLVGALAMTGAAAFGGHHSASPVVAANHRAASMPDTRFTPLVVRQTAASTLHQLERVVHRHSRGAQVVALANHLHDQISAIIAQSPHDARSLGQVTHLLRIEQRLLESNTSAAATKALAASRRLTHLLEVRTQPTALPTVAPTPHHTSTPQPTHTTSSTPQPAKSTSSSSNPIPTSKPTHPHPTHHHSHHGRKKHPLLGSVLLNTKL